MYAAERQNSLVRRARAQGRVDVATCAIDLQVTAETIRRDLRALDRQGLLRRVHGGAIPADPLGVEPELVAPIVLPTAEEERIAAAALALLDGQRTVLLDGSATTVRLAQLLPLDRTLTVVTNSLTIASLLAPRVNTTVQLLGGRVRGPTLSSVDSWALRGLGGLTVDLALLGADGFSVERGFTTPDLAEGAVRQAMVATARRTVVLADAGKHGTDALVRFATLSEIDVLITDGRLDPGAARHLRAGGPNVVLV